jgi:glycosyltransferase involved in cell wall biosynthesis
VPEATASPSLHSATASPSLHSATASPSLRSAIAKPSARGATPGHLDRVKPRILEICLDKGNGGLELYFHRCGGELRKRGFEVVTLRTDGTFLADLLDGETRRDVLFPPHAPWKRVLCARKLRDLIELHAIDVVHAHHKDDLPLIALARSIGGRATKLYFTRQMPLPSPKRDPYHRWVYGKVDGMIAISEKLRRDILEKIPILPERVHLLYYGVPAAPERDEAWCRSFLSISREHDFNVGVFSRFEQQKGQHTAVEALRLLRERGVPAKLYLAGNVADEQYLSTLRDRIRAARLDDAVAFKGFLKEPMHAMQAVDVYVLPSRAEAFGLVLAEAMRCGTAVIGTNAGGVPEIIEHGETGLLYAWDDAEELAQLLERAYREPEWRASLAARGKAKADDAFDERRHFDRLAEILSGAGDAQRSAPVAP